MSSEGQQEIDNLSAAGFSSDEVNSWKAQRQNELTAAGFNNAEVGDYFGQPVPDKTAAALQQHFQETVGAAAAVAKGDGTTEPKPFTFADAAEAGWQMSVAGLMSRGKAPDITLPADNTWGQRLVSSAAMYGADLPVMVLGGAGAGLAGLPTGPGAVAAAGAGAFGLPAGLRAIMMRSYEKGEVHTPGEFLSLSGGILWDTAKGAATGALTALSGVGGRAAAGAAGAVKGGFTETLAGTAAELGTMVTVPKILEGQLPSAQDFVDAATALAFFKTVPHVATTISDATTAARGKVPEVASTLRDIFSKTGKQPADVINDAAQDPTVHQDVIIGNVPDAYKNQVDPYFKPDINLTDQALLDLRGIKAAALRDPDTGELFIGKDHDAAAEAFINKNKSANALHDKFGDGMEGPNVGFVTKDGSFISREEAKSLFGVDDTEGIANLKYRTRQREVSTVAPEPGTLEAAQKNILDKVQVGGETPKQKLTFDDIYTATVDSMNPLRNAVKEMTGGKELDVGEDPYKLARLSRGIFGKADQFLTNSPFEFDTYKNVGKSLKDILEPFKGDLQGVRAYAVAKRAQELDARGVKSGFDPIAVQKVLDENGSKYDAVVKDLTDYQDHLTKYLRDSGVLSKETYDAMQEANKSYVPFYRVFDQEGLTGGPGKGFGTFNPIKEIKGSDRSVIDPIESIIKNTYTYLALADRNEIGQKFVELARDSGRLKETGSAGIGHNGGPPLAEKVKSPIKGTQVTEEEMRSFLQKQGIDDVPDDMLTVFRGIHIPLAADEIAVFNDGKREVYRLDPETAAIFKSSDKEVTNWIFKALSAPASLMRAGVTLSPDFFPRNLIRDQFAAFVNSDNGFIPLVSTVQGIAAILGKTSDYQNWLKSGGANATMVAVDRRYIQNNVIKLNEQTGFRDAVWNVVKSPVDALRVVSELAENATRVGEFIAASNPRMDKNDIQSAGFDSREVTLDFARIGAKTAAVNQLVPFWNAPVQGIDRMARAFKADPTGVGIKIMASVAIPSLLLWWANKDDPRYRNAPDWQKDNFWIVPTDNWRALKEGEAAPPQPYLQRSINGEMQYNMGTTYRIPKTQETGILFGSGVERFADHLYANDPDSLKKFTKDALQSYLPGMVPAFAEPIMEQWANKSFFTGNKIVPSATEALLPEVQYQPYTTETTKALGRLIGTVPGMNTPGSLASGAVIENYVRQWSTGLGMYALQIADYGLRKTGILPDPLMPTATLADIPFIKAFVVRYPSAGAQPIQDFYDKYQTKQQFIDTMKYLAKSGDPVASVRFSEENLNNLGGQLTGVKDAMTNMQKVIQLTYKNPMLPEGKKLSDLTSAEKDSIRDQKRQIIEPLYYQMIEAARIGNEQMKSLDEAMAK